MTACVAVAGLSPAPQKLRRHHRRRRDDRLARHPYYCIGAVRAASACTCVHTATLARLCIGQAAANYRDEQMSTCRRVVDSCPLPRRPFLDPSSFSIPAPTGRPCSSVPLIRPPASSASPDLLQLHLLRCGLEFLQPSLNTRLARETSSQSGALKALNLTSSGEGRSM
jgi:hypothetical protein